MKKLFLGCYESLIRFIHKRLQGFCDFLEYLFGSYSMRSGLLFAQIWTYQAMVQNKPVWSRSFYPDIFILVFLFPKHGLFIHYAPSFSGLLYGL